MPNLLEFSELLCHRLMMIGRTRALRILPLLCGLPLLLAPKFAAAAETHEQMAQQMYVAYYGRPGDPVGIDFWADRIAEAGGVWITDLVDSFGAAVEYTERFGALSDQELINNLYLQLYNRPAETQGLAFYVDLLRGSNSSGLNPELRQSSLANIALDIANGSQGEDLVSLQNKLALSEYFTDSIRQTGRLYGPSQVENAVAIVSEVGSSPITLMNGFARVDEFVGQSPAGIALNDTGITRCWDGTSSGGSCPVTGFIGQDAESGRDLTTNIAGDGHAGFSFTKLDSEGAVLPEDAFSWSCIRDNVTGLIWEVKTDDDGLNDRDDEFTWYSSDPSANGGFAGFADAAGNECFGYDSANPDTYCNTQAFAQRVNAVALCGLQNWRMPSIYELASLVSNDRIEPAIDTAYFIGTGLSYFWSSTPYLLDQARAWYVDFITGELNDREMDRTESVRLVSSGS